MQAVASNMQLLQASTREEELDEAAFGRLMPYTQFRREFVRQFLATARIEGGTAREGDAALSSQLDAFKSDPLRAVRMQELYQQEGLASVAACASVTEQLGQVLEALEGADEAQQEQLRPEVGRLQAELASLARCQGRTRESQGYFALLSGQVQEDERRDAARLRSLLHYGTRVVSQWEGALPLSQYNPEGQPVVVKAAPAGLREAYTVAFLRLDAGDDALAAGQRALAALLYQLGLRVLAGAMALDGKPWRLQECVAVADAYAAQLQGTLLRPGAVPLRQALFPPSPQHPEIGSSSSAALPHAGALQLLASGEEAADAGEAVHGLELLQRGLSSLLSQASAAPQPQPQGSPPAPAQQQLWHTLEAQALCSLYTSIGAGATGARARSEPNPLLALTHPAAQAERQRAQQQLQQEPPPSAQQQQQQQPLPTYTCPVCLERHAVHHPSTLRLENCGHYMCRGSLLGELGANLRIRRTHLRCFALCHQEEASTGGGGGASTCACASRGR